MKKKMILMIVLLLAVMTAAGCGGNGLEDYKKAVDKTSQIERGQSSAEFTLNMDFYTNGMLPEEIAKLNYYSEMSGSFQSAFDKAANQMIARSYLNLGGLGIDFDLYENGDELFLKLPIAGKYIRMGDVIRGADAAIKPEDTPELISEDTRKALSRMWVDLMNQDNVFKGKDIVLSTPDGEVKTTVYTITLTDEEFKTAAGNAADIFSKDENLKKNFSSYAEKASGQKITGKWKPDQFFSDMKEWLKECRLENFQYTAYVDIDGYIVNETLEFKLKRNATSQGEPETINYKLDMKNWDINKKQQFEFPVLTEDNTIKTENMKETMPSLFKDLFPDHQ